MASRPQFTPRIVVIEGKDKGKVVPFAAGTTVIGRSKGDVLIHDPRISRSHIAIEWNPHKNKLTFTDLKSLNGTLLNDEVVEGGELKDGDKLQLGNTLFDCQVVEPPSESKIYSKAAAPAKIDTISEMRRREPKPDEPLEPSFDDIGLVSGEPEPQNFSDSEPTPEKEAKAEARDSRAEKKKKAKKSKDAKEPRAPEQAPAAQRVETGEEKTTSGFRLPAWRRYYLNLPRKTRVYGLCATALLFTMIYSFSGSNGGNETTTDREVASIRDLEKQGKVAEAITKAEQLRSANPERTEFHVLLGDLYAQTGKIALAIEAYLAVLNLDPQQTVLHIHLARLYLTTGQAKEAEVQNRQIDRILIEGPHSKEFFVEVAKLYMTFPTLDVPPKKMIIIGQALQNKFAPGETVGLKLEASGLILEDRAADAVAVLEKARKLDPQDESVLQYMVVSKIRAKDPAGATQVVEEWMAAFPNAVQPRLFMAHWKYETRAYPEALAELQAILKITASREDDPALTDTLSLMAKVYLAQGQPDEARQNLQRACQLGHAPSCDHNLLKSGVVAEPPTDTVQTAPSDNQ